MYSAQEFEKLLTEDRPAALRALMHAWVDRWLEDGPEEIVRVLSTWAERGPSTPPGHAPRIDLGSDEEIIEQYLFRTGQEG